MLPFLALTSLLTAGIISTVSAAPKAPSVTHPRGCPAITITTSNITSTVYVSPTTSTITFTENPTVTTTTVITTFTFPTTVYSTTKTSTSFYSTNTRLVVSPAKTTVSQPTPAGFTPVRCDPAYYASYNVATTSITINPSYSYVTVLNTSSTSTEVVSQTNFAYITTTLRQTTTTVYDVKTTTSTRKDATQTIYAACATNNVTPDFPGPGHKTVKFVGNALYNNSYTDLGYAVALNATDCCGVCQATSGCTGSTFTTLSGDPYCTLYLADTGGCDAKRLIGGDASSVGPGETFDISNGPCGRFDFQFYN